MKDIADININVLSTPPKKVDWSHESEWAGYHNGEQLWGEHSETAQELTIDDAIDAYESALEHFDEVTESVRATWDTMVRFYRQIAKTEVSDARRRLQEVLDGVG